MDTTALSNMHISIASTYSVVMLLFLSLLGISGHVLSDIAKLQQAKIWVGAREYFNSTWSAIALSFVICLVIIIVRHEMMQIPDFSDWEGLGMALCGFCGRSMLIPALNWLKKFGIKTEDTPE